VAEAPYLVSLDHFAGEIDQLTVLILGAGFPEVDQQFRVIVFLAAPVIRTVARMLLPSTSAPMIWARFSVDRRFMGGL
jgi:hypothetical protein